MPITVSTITRTSTEYVLKFGIAEIRAYQTAAEALMRLFQYCARNAEAGIVLNSETLAFLIDTVLEEADVVQAIIAAAAQSKES